MLNKINHSIPEPTAVKLVFHHHRRQDDRSQFHRYTPHAVRPMLLHSQILPIEGILYQFNAVTLLHCHINTQNVILDRLVTVAVTISGTRLLGSTQTDRTLRFNNSSPILVQSKSKVAPVHAINA